MNRQEAEKIKDELLIAYGAGELNARIAYKESGQEWFNRTYPPEPEYIPFEWQDWKLFMGQPVRRKGKHFKDDIYQIEGFKPTCVLIFDGIGFDWKSFGYMFEEWEFSDGTPFGKSKK